MEIKDYQLISKNTSEADIYRKYYTIYKIYKPLRIQSPYFIKEYIKIMEDRKKKVSILQDIDLPNTAMPIELLFGDLGEFIGYSMPYISSTSLVDFKFDDSKSFLGIVSECSKTLRLIHEHPAKICVGDMHFGNIMLDSHLKPYYIDCDSWKIGRIDGLVCSEYIRFLQKKKRICRVNQNSDSISLFISTYRRLFGNRVFDYIDQYDYDELAEQSSFLRSSREIFCKLKSKSFKIPKVPYIDDFIDEDKQEEIIFTKKR